MEEAHKLPAHVSFVDLGSAAITLFVVSMGDGWTSLMSACSISPSDYPRTDNYMQVVIPNLQAYQLFRNTPVGQKALATAKNNLPGDPPWRLPLPR